MGSHSLCPDQGSPLSNVTACTESSCTHCKKSWRRRTHLMELNSLWTLWSFKGNNPWTWQRSNKMIKGYRKQGGFMWRWFFFFDGVDNIIRQRWNQWITLYSLLFEDSYCRRNSWLRLCCNNCGVPGDVLFVEVVGFWLQPELREGQNTLCLFYTNKTTSSPLPPSLLLLPPPQNPVTVDLRNV